VGTYGGTGSSTNVVATYNKTLAVSTPTNDTNDIIVDMPPNWSSYIIINFTNIIASPLILDIETNESATESRDQLPGAMSFQVTNSCYLYSIMVKLYASMTNLRDGFDLWIEIYNATNDAGRPKPESVAISSAVFLDLGDSSSSYDGWQNVSWVGGVYLNTSATYNNYFFAVATQWPGAFPEWKWRLDSETGDNGYAWRSAPWTEHVGIDYFLNVSIVPTTLTPAPSQISMQVNATSVQDGVANAGWWERDFTPSSKSILFDISTTWPVTLSYTYVSRYSRTFSGTTEFLASSQFALTNWNITSSLSFPSISADANSRTMNFSLPSHWEAQALLNGSTPVPFSRFKDNSTNPGLPGWLFLDEPGGTGNGTMWRVVSFDTNYVQTPIIRRDGSDVTGQEVNITDTLTVSAQLSIFSDGIGRLNPYDELGGSLNEWLQPPDGGGLLTFPAFLPTSYAITNVTMQCEVVWNNSLHAGVGLSSVDLVYPTTLTGDPDDYTSLIGDNANIRVYYYDTENSVGIPNADVNVTFSGSTYSLGDVGGGYYESSIDTGAMGLGRGIHLGLASADRPGYSPSTIPVTLTLWSKTQLIANWTTLTINYTESVAIEVNYSIFTPLGEGGITGALVNISGPGYFNWLAEEGGGNYSIVLAGPVLGVGIHNLVINASKPSTYIQENTLLVTLTVEGEPTNITGSAPGSIDGGELFNVSITYRKQSDGTGISGATISCLLDDSPFAGFIVYDLLNGTYHVTFILNVSGSPATFNITLTAALSGYNNAVYDTLIDVQIRPTTISVLVLSAPTVVYNSPFQIQVTYQDMSAQGVIGANIQGNWTTINFIDNLDGTYTVNCITTGSSAGAWTISFNISALNYEIEYFSESFDLVWATSLTPENGDYSPNEFENETLVLNVLFWDESNSLAIDGATVWAIFQSNPHSLVASGSGVYQLSLNLTEITPGPYSLTIFAQRALHENQTLILSLEVLAKFDALLTVTLPPPNSVVEGREVAVTVGLTFTNATPISGAEIWLDVWIHYSNGTNQILYAQLITTDTFGTRIVLVQLPSYTESFWMNNNGGPHLWAAAIYNGTRETASQMASVSEVISQVAAVPWWVDLLLFLLPFIIIFIIILILIWTYYAKRVKPRRLAQQQALEQSASQWAQRMMGLMDLRALFVTFSKTGLPIFTYDFSGGEMPSTLLSGFLSAVNSFYSELSGEGDRESQLRDIHYKDLHLSLREGQYVVSVLILDSSPSEVLTNSLAQFTTGFEARFGDQLTTFDGRIDVFDPATEIVEECFHGELLLAYECAKAPSRGFSRKIYDLAVKLANEEGRLYLPQLFVAAIEKFGAQKKYDIANALEHLHEQGCLIPVEGNKIAQDETPDNPNDPSVFFE
jgi:hypothetical protein